MTPPNGRRTIVIGLDGVPWTALGPLMARGHMPNLAALAARGASSTCLSPICPMSPIAWSGIATGKNPGKHGVFDWTYRKAGTYDLEMVSSACQRGPTIWDLASAAGLKAGVFNVPVTYPPRPVNGFMVTCMLTPSNQVTFTHPPELSPGINELVGGYEFATREVISPGHEQRFIDSVLATLEKRQAALDFLLDRHAIDFGLLVYTESDTIQHKLWPPEGFDAADPAWPSSGVTEIYDRLDRAVGRLVERLGPETNILILSDHGAGEMHGVMYVNRWLMNLGYLRLKRTFTYPLKWFLARTDLLVRGYWLASRLGLGWLGRLVPKSIQYGVATNFVSFADVDWPHTRAYSMGEFGQIYLNLKGREPLGIVEPGAEAETILADLAARLKEIRHPATGGPLITSIWRRNEAFHGPAADQGADLLFAIDDYAYEASVQFGIGSRDILGEAEFKDRGCHRPEGILIAAGPDIAPAGRIADTTIMDVAPTVLHLLGLPVPQEMDGRVIREMLTGQAAARPTRSAETSVEAQAPAPQDAPVMSTDEQRAVEERLRNLGYLD